MRYNILGNTGLLVSELCVGTMTFGGGTEGLSSLIGNVQQDEADQQVRVALDAGINFFDTADVYGHGRSEEITGQAFKNLGLRRPEFVIATKFSGNTGNLPNTRGGTRTHIMEAVKASLKRLQVDYIDLYQMHDIDPLTPIEETLSALDQLVQDGLVRYIGVSNWHAWELAKALGISERKGTTRLQSLQAYYSLVSRDIEREIVPLLRSEKVGLMIWGPLAGGFLTGKYKRDDSAQEGGRRAKLDFPPLDRDRSWAVIDAMQPIAEAKGASLGQIALAWLLHQPVVTSVVIGSKNVEQLADNIASTKVALSSEDLKILDEASALTPEYTDWMAIMSDELPWDPRHPKPRDA